MILLDTNSLIHYLKGVAPLVERFHATPKSELAIPAIVAYEVEYGTLKGGSQRRAGILENVLSGVRQVPFDHQAALEAAKIRLHLESRRELIGPMDLLIAATAVSRGAVLVTNSRREFGRVPGLRVEDWTL